MNVEPDGRIGSILAVRHGGNEQGQRMGAALGIGVVVDVVTLLLHPTQMSARLIRKFAVVLPTCQPFTAADLVMVA